MTDSEAPWDFDEPVDVDYLMRLATEGWESMQVAICRNCGHLHGFRIWPAHRDDRPRNVLLDGLNYRAPQLSPTAEGWLFWALTPDRWELWRSRDRVCVATGSLEAVVPVMMSACCGGARRRTET